MTEEDKIIEEIVQESLKCPKMYPECVREAVMKALAKGKEIGNKINICETHNMVRVACQKCYQADLEFNLKPIEREKDELHSQNSQLIDDMNDQASKIAEFQEEVRKLRLRIVEHEESRNLLASALNDSQKRVAELEKENKELKEVIGDGIVTKLQDELENLGVGMCPYAGCRKPAIWESSECVDNYCDEHLREELRKPEEEGWYISCNSCKDAIVNTEKPCICGNKPFERKQLANELEKWVNEEDGLKDDIEKIIKRLRGEK